MGIGVSKWGVRRLVPSDGMVHEAPSPNATAGLIKDWITLFPADTGVHTNGFSNFFEDGRIAWGAERLGGIAAANVLELGPLEGAQTCLLERAGAQVTAIEANKRNYLKCLITKELMGARNARFLLGNFVPWLETSNEKFDVIWASGVLYHMREPLRLLRAIAAHTDKVFIWTHYFPDGGNPRRPPFFRMRPVHFAGRQIPHFDRLYLRPRWRPLACGGPAAGSCWLRRDDILFALRALGFSRIEVGHEDHRPYRNSITLVAQRVSLPPGETGAGVAHAPSFGS
jgi:SAM-dependent methyltransferase